MVHLISAACLCLSFAWFFSRVNQWLGGKALMDAEIGLSAFLCTLVFGILCSLLELVPSQILAAAVSFSTVLWLLTILKPLTWYLSRRRP